MRPENSVKRSLFARAFLSQIAVGSPLVATENKEKTSVTEYVQLVTELHDRCDDEMLGMLAQRVPIGSLSMFCRMFVHNPTTEESIRHYASFYGLFTDARQPLILVESSDSCFSIVVNKQLPQAEKPYFTYSTLPSAVKLLTYCSLSVPKQRVAECSEDMKRMLGYSIHSSFMGMVDGKHPKRLLEGALTLALSYSAIF